MRLTTNPGALFDGDGRLAKLPRKRRSCVVGSITGLQPTHYLHQRHDGYGIEEMQSHESFRTRDRGRELGYRYRRGVRGNNGLSADQRIHLPEDLSLELVILRRGLDDDLCGLETVVYCRWFDPPDRSVLFSRAHLALCDYPAKTPLDGVNPFFDSLLVEVEQDHINAFHGRNLGNSITHDSGPDDPNRAYLHRRKLPR